MIRLSGSDPAMSLLTLKRSTEIDRGYYAVCELQFYGYYLKTGAVSEIVATRTAKRPKVGVEIVLEVPGREVLSLKVPFYASVQTCGLK